MCFVSKICTEIVLIHILHYNKYIFCTFNVDVIVNSVLFYIVQNNDISIGILINSFNSGFICTPITIIAPFHWPYGDSWRAFHCPCCDCTVTKPLIWITRNHPIFALYCIHGTLLYILRVLCGLNWPGYLLEIKNELGRLLICARGIHD